MKKIMFISLFLIFLIVPSLQAQSGLESYSQRYNAGERSVGFMKEYVKLLKENKRVVELEKVADSYLVLVPLKERYKDFNLNVFIDGVRKYNDVSFRDLIKNWDICTDKSNLEIFQTKIKNVYASELFTIAYNNKTPSEEFCSTMRNDMKKLALPVATFYGSLLDITCATKKADFKRINQLIKEVYTSKEPKGWNEMLVINSALSKVVDEGDLATSKELLNILKPLREKEVKSPLDSVSESLEGKILMMENK